MNSSNTSLTNTIIMKDMLVDQLPRAKEKFRKDNSKFSCVKGKHKLTFFDQKLEPANKIGKIAMYQNDDLESIYELNVTAS